MSIKLRVHELNVGFVCFIVVCRSILINKVSTLLVMVAQLVLETLVIQMNLFQQLFLRMVSVLCHLCLIFLLWCRVRLITLFDANILLACFNTVFCLCCILLQKLIIVPFTKHFEQVHWCDHSELPSATFNWVFMFYLFSELFN